MFHGTDLVVVPFVVLERVNALMSSRRLVFDVGNYLGIYLSRYLPNMAPLPFLHFDCHQRIRSWQKV